MEDFDFVIPLIDEKLTDAIDRKMIDVEYCNQSPSQKMDIYFPNAKSDKPYPVIVYFHGGAFMKGTKHAGFGLGFERLVMYVTGMQNIRDVLPFPRTTGSAEF